MWPPRQGEPCDLTPPPMANRTSSRDERQAKRTKVQAEPRSVAPPVATTLPYHPQRVLCFLTPPPPASFSFLSQRGMHALETRTTGTTSAATRARTPAVARPLVTPPLLSVLFFSSLLFSSLPPSDGRARRS